MEKSLKPFFYPKGVAVVGVSHQPEKLGYGLARNFLFSDFQGAIHFVNRKGGTLFDRPVYERISEIPDPVDLAELLIPAQLVPQAIKDCDKRGIKAIIIASGGFGETGEEGAALEEECLCIARNAGIRLVGPNCIGLLDTHLPLDTTFLPPPGPTPGNVAFISHSGAMCAAVIDWARGQGFGFSRLVSLGNQIDVNETDVLQPVVEDEYTRVLTLYLEGVSDGQLFVEEATKAVREKPLIALKVGRFESGQNAVASHTGALAGQESAYNAAFRRAGVIRADTSEEMFDWARALAWCPLPKGRNVGILTNAGGPGVTAADALELHGLNLAKLSGKTIEALKKELPPAASLANPVDMLASASPLQYAHSLEFLLSDPGVDSVLVILPPPPMFTSAGVANALIPIIQLSEKPVLIALMGERLIQEAVERLRGARILEYRFPERAASALAVLSLRAEVVGRKMQKGISLGGVDKKIVEEVLDRTHASNIEFLPEEDTREILKAYGLPMIQMQLAKTPEQAIDIAEKIGYPVVLKIASLDVIHKTDFGGVLLDISNPNEVEKGFENIIKSIRAGNSKAEITGIYVQEMIAEGQEVIAGAIQDSQFGALVMFGSGGIEVEGLEDIDYMLSETWAGLKLKGFRNIPEADREAVQEVIIRLAQLAADFPRIIEVEINPLRVLSKGLGAYAVDARMKV